MLWFHLKSNFDLIILKIIEMFGYHWRTFIRQFDCLDPLVSNVMYPWSKSWSICGELIYFMDSLKSSASAKTRQGLIWLARKNAGLATLFFYGTGAF